MPGPLATLAVERSQDGLKISFRRSKARRFELVAVVVNDLRRARHLPAKTTLTLAGNLIVVEITRPPSIPSDARTSAHKDWSARMVKIVNIINGGLQVSASPQTIVKRVAQLSE
jgi:hypothetical protein